MAIGNKLTRTRFKPRPQPEATNPQKKKEILSRLLIQALKEAVEEARLEDVNFEHKPNEEINLGGQ